MRMCRNPQCERRFPIDVHFCPYCGEAQRTSPSRVGASRNVFVMGDSARSQDQKTADASAREQDDEALSPALATVIGAVDVPSTSAHAGIVPLYTSRLTVLATRPVTWMLVVAIALLWLAPLQKKLSKVIPFAEYESVSCAGTIASELSVLVDLPAQLEPSTKAELLVRLSQQLDAEHVGVQRMNLFSTAPEHGDAATPIFSACTSRAALVLVPLAWSRSATQIAFCRQRQGGHDSARHCSGAVGNYAGRRRPFGQPISTCPTEYPSGVFGPD